MNQTLRLSRVALCAIACMATSAAWAQPSNPFQPLLSNITALQDATSSFTGAQLSSFQGQSPAFLGVEYDVRFEVGPGGFGDEDFSRVVLQGFNLPNDLSAFDGLAWNVLSTTDIFISPYIQTDPGFSFSQANSGTSVPAGVETMVFLDFNDVAEFANPIDPSDVRAWGMQFFGPSVGNGDPVGTVEFSLIQVTSKTVPEPTGAAICCVSGLVALASRRRR